MSSYKSDLETVVKAHETLTRCRLHYKWLVGKLMATAMVDGRGWGKLKAAFSKVNRDLVKATGESHEYTWYVNAEKLYRLISHAEVEMLIQRRVAVGYVEWFMARKDKDRIIDDIRTRKNSYPFMVRAKPASALSRHSSAAGNVELQEEPAGTIVIHLESPPRGDVEFDRMVSELANKFACMRRILGADVLERAWQEARQLAGG